MSDARCHTFTHQGFDPLHPRAKDVRLEDIAHGLAMICRYGGQAPVYYSVAEHAVKVSRLVGAVTGNVNWALHALHHDSAEAYIGDQRKPLKDALWFRTDDDATFSEVEKNIADAIFLGIKLPMIGDDTGEQDDVSACMAMDDAIHDADLSLLRAEMAAFWGEENRVPAPWTTKIYQRECLDWERAEGLFLSEHARLKAGRLWQA
jgi:hypothetical protein